MKKLIFIFFLLGSMTLFAQRTGTYFGAGYNVGYYNGLTSLNNVVNNFDHKNSWMTEMPSFNRLQGISFEIFMFKYGGHSFSIGWSGNNQTNEASGIDGTGKKEFRQIKIENNEVDLGVGYTLFHSQRFNIFFGTCLNIGFSPYYTRSWNEDVKVPDFGKPVGKDNFNLSISLFPHGIIKVVHTSVWSCFLIDLKPYFDFNFIPYDYNSLAKSLNLNNQNDNQYISTPNHFGLDVKIMWGWDGFIN